MTMPSRIERNLPGILDELSMAPAPDYLDDVFGRTGRMRQRPAWTFPGRWLPMADVARLRAVAPAPPWRLFALGLLVLALIAAALLTVGAQRRAAPPFGPASNGQVVYVAKGDVYIGDPATGATRLLLGGPEIDSGPGYSPDGTKVAFLRSAGCCPDVYDIYAMREDGSDVRKITASPIADLSYANWAPNSRQIAVNENAADGGKLYLLDVEGREPPRPLARDMDVADAVAFRPPLGNEIAFRALVDKGWGIFVMNADGTNIRPLMDPVPVEMDFHAANIAYSVDGKQLFYQSYVPADERAAEGCCQLWVMNADGTDPHAVEEHREAWSGVPNVSPDGRWVSYWYVFGDGSHRVKVVPADGSKRAVFTGPDMPDFAPWIWAPDSSKILLAAAAGSDTAYLLNPEGGPYTTVPWGAEMDWQRLAP